VYPEGIRHIRADKRVNEWRAPGKRTINKCALNERQVCWEGEEREGAGGESGKRGRLCRGKGVL